MEENMLKKIKAIFLVSLLSFCLVNTNSIKSADFGPHLSTDISTAEGLFNSVGCFGLGALFWRSALSGVVFETVEDFECFVKLTTSIAIPSFILAQLFKNPDN